MHTLEKSWNLFFTPWGPNVFNFWGHIRLFRWPRTQELQRCKTFLCSFNFAVLTCCNRSNASEVWCESRCFCNTGRHCAFERRWISILESFVNSTQTTTCKTLHHCAGSWVMQIVTWSALHIVVLAQSMRTNTCSLHHTFCRCLNISTPLSQPTRTKVSSEVVSVLASTSVTNDKCVVQLSPDRENSARDVFLRRSLFFHPPRQQIERERVCVCVWSNEAGDSGIVQTKISALTVLGGLFFLWQCTFNPHQKTNLMFIPVNQEDHKVQPCHDLLLTFFSFAHNNGQTAKMDALKIQRKSRF